MIQKLTTEKHTQPFKGPFSITRVHPELVFPQNDEDTAFGPLSIIDHAVMQKGLTIKMHEHVSDEILSYVWQGTMVHKDSAGFEVAITPGNVMMMNAGSSFWHEEKVNENHVEMLQIFFRPREANLEPNIQFHQKEMRNREWTVIVGPEGSEAPLYVRQKAYVLDAHPKQGDQLSIPRYDGYATFLYVLDGEIQIHEQTVKKMEAIASREASLPPLTALKDTTIVLFFVNLNAPMSMAGTISGIGQK